MLLADDHWSARAAIKLLLGDTDREVDYLEVETFEKAIKAVEENSDLDLIVGNRGQATTVEWMKRLAEVHVDAVYASDQPQSRDPAAAIAATKGVEVQIDERLRDQELGEWQGRPWDEIAAQEPDRVRELRVFVTLPAGFQGTADFAFVVSDEDDGETVRADTQFHGPQP